MQAEKESSKIKMIKCNHLLLFVFICLLFVGCKKNNRPSQNGTAIIKPNKLILSKNMLCFHMDIDNSAYKSVYYNTTSQNLELKTTNKWQEKRK